MRTALLPTLAVVFLLALAGRGMAAEYEGQQRFICAVTGVQDCLTGEGCKGVEPEELNLPRFIVVDPVAKVLTAPQENRSSAIRDVERLSGLIVLQGAEETNERRDSFGWSMSIDDKTGDMVFVASGQRQAVVVNGACMEK